MTIGSLWTFYFLLLKRNTDSVYTSYLNLSPQRLPQKSCSEWSVTTKSDEFWESLNQQKNQRCLSCECLNLWWRWRRWRNDRDTRWRVKRVMKTPDRRRSEDVVSSSDDLRTLLTFNQKHFCTQLYWIIQTWLFYCPGERISHTKSCSLRLLTSSLCLQQVKSIFNARKSWLPVVRRNSILAKLVFRLNSPESAVGVPKEQLRRAELGSKRCGFGERPPRVGPAAGGTSRCKHVLLPFRGCKER